MSREKIRINNIKQYPQLLILIKVGDINTPCSDAQFPKLAHSFLFFR